MKVDFIDSTETASLVKMNLPDATAEVLWSTGSPDLTLAGDEVTSGVLAIGQIVRSRGHPIWHHHNSTGG